MSSPEIQNEGFSLDRPLPVEMHPNIDHLVTEDNAPVDNIFSEKQQRLLAESLNGNWQREGNEPFVAFANVGLFYKLHGTPYVPDVMVSLDVRVPDDVWKKQNRSYLVWEYGKPPEIVIEVVSNREGGEEADKLKGYARIGVKYYVIHDPGQYLSKTVLKVFKLDGDSYQSMAEPWYFTGLGIGVKLWDGVYENSHETWLRWYDGRGTLIPTGAERADSAEQRADSAEQRADSAEQRADSAEQRADSAEQRAAALAETLRRHGFDPNAPVG